jgi:Phage integrase family
MQPNQHPPRISTAAARKLASDSESRVADNSGDKNHHASKEVRHAVESYRPDVGDASVDVVTPFVRAVVLDYAPRTRGVARHYLTSVAKLAEWSWQTVGLDLNAEDVFRHDHVERFVHENMKLVSDTYRAQTAQRLNRLVVHFNGATALDPSLRTPRAESVASIYKESQLTNFVSAAIRRTTNQRRVNGHVLLGLGRGAGARTEEIAELFIRDIEDDGDNITVNFTGKFPRSVPVHHAWVRTLRTGIDGRDGSELAFIGYRRPAYRARVVHQFHLDDRSDDTPQAHILRATWIVGLLEAGVRLDLLMNLAGFTSPTSLAAYVRAMRKPDVSAWLDLVSGTGVTR